MTDKDLDYLRFALTVKFKSHLIAVSVENNIKHHTPGYTIPDDIRTWKYYVNMSGGKHFLDKDIVYNLPTTNETVILTKEYLDNNPNIRNYIKTVPGELDRIITANKTSVMYLLGMLYPIDIDRVLSAKEGEILSYDDTFIADYELNVIKDLEDYIKNILYRYSNPGYIITDDLYGAGLYVIILHAIAMKVKELRYYNAGTYAVSDELLELKLNSTCYIAGLVSDLPRNVRLYLYKNIDYLIHNAGQVNTTQMIIDRVLKPLGLICRTVTVEPTNMKLVNAPYDEPNQLKAYETLYLEEHDDTNIEPVGYQTLFEHGLDNIEYEKAEAYADTLDTKNPIENRVKHDKGVKEPSKQNVIESIYHDIEVRSTKERVLIEATLLLLINTKDTDYAIEYNGTTYVHKGRDVLMLLLYYMERIFDMDKRITSINFTNIIWYSSQRSQNDLLKGIDHSGGVGDAYNGIIDDINNRLAISPDDVTTTTTANEFVKQSLTIITRFYGHMSLANNGVISSNITLLYNRYREPFVKSITDICEDQTPEQYVIANTAGNGESPMDNIISIVKSLTGYTLDSYTEKEKRLANMAELMKRLSSYTVNYIPYSNKTDYLLKRSTIEPLHGKEIISLKNVTYDCKGSIADPDVEADDGLLGMSFIASTDLYTKTTIDRTVPDMAVTEVKGITILDDARCFVIYT